MTKQQMQQKWFWVWNNNKFNKLSCHLACNYFILTMFWCKLLNRRTATGNLFVKLLSLGFSGPIKFLTSLLERSLKTSSHRYIGFSSSELAEGLTQIAVNDSNKKTVKRCSVVNFVFYSRSSGLMVSALGSGLSGLGSSLAGIIWARHFSLTVSLSTQV